MRKSKKGLNEKQEAFCQFLATPNEDGSLRSRSEAYRAAYPSCNSHGNAKRAASRLLKEPQIRARMAELTSAIYHECVEQVIPFQSIVYKLRDRLNDDRHPAVQIAAIKLALKVREKYLEEYAVENEFAHLSDEELIRRAMGMFEG